MEGEVRYPQGSTPGVAAAGSKPVLVQLCANSGAVQRGVRGV